MTKAEFDTAVDSPAALPQPPGALAPNLPRQLSDAEFALLAAAGTRREVAPPETIIRKGEFGRTMFVIESGRILLEFGGELPDKLIGPREYFGELALFVGNHARVASASATEPCVLHVLDHDAFERVLRQSSALVAQFMRRSFAYLVASEQQLIANLRRRNEDLMLTLDSLRQTQDQLTLAQRQIRTDDLTGLCNRRGLYRHLERLNELRDPERQFGLLLVDLDDFKQINDHYGHLTGDGVLRAVAQELQAASAPVDLPCRLGGDEFALLVQVRDRRELAERAALISEAARQLRFPHAPRSLKVTVSVGGSLCRDESAWSVWYSDADCALYHVKGSGGDGWHVLP
ncbi:diguanylate cyclase [Mizugakiibacter sediminis]|uniref:diguanylate cyclase n=1 Tax=Mizugakiibacter sediminis TaxID=1475481 RepID=A0A0K8QIS4_9GAMM|nr:GGDEF domain-containing protein [Mizugakiibacter sediminis]GAP64850.1 diguanylate cyclase [Mizugakiibacter sediminis]